MASYSSWVRDPVFSCLVKCLTTSAFPLAAGLDARRHVFAVDVDVHQSVVEPARGAQLVCHQRGLIRLVSLGSALNWWVFSLMFSIFQNYLLTMPLIFRIWFAGT